MTIERIMIAVLFMLMVRMEIKLIDLSIKHNALTTTVRILTGTLCDILDGFTDEYDRNMLKGSKEYRKFRKETDDD